MKRLLIALFILSASLSGCSFTTNPKESSSISMSVYPSRIQEFETNRDALLPVGSIVKAVTPSTELVIVRNEAEEDAKGNTWKYVATEYKENPLGYPILVYLNDSNIESVIQINNCDMNEPTADYAERVLPKGSTVTLNGIDHEWVVIGRNRYHNLKMYDYALMEKRDPLSYAFVDQVRIKEVLSIGFSSDEATEASQSKRLYDVLRAQHPDQYNYASKASIYKDELALFFPHNWIQMDNQTYPTILNIKYWIEYKQLFVEYFDDVHTDANWLHDFAKKIPDMMILHYGEVDEDAPVYLKKIGNRDVYIYEFSSVVDREVVHMIYCVLSINDTHFQLLYSSVDPIDKYDTDTIKNFLEDIVKL